MAKNLKKISVETAPNGYVLNYCGNEHLYFNEVDLLAGFLSRVGAGETKDMERGDILNTLFDLMLGEKYANDVANIQQTVERMKERYTEHIKKLSEKINLLNDATNKHDEVMSSVRTMTELVSKLQENYEHALTPVKDFNTRIVKLEGKTSAMESKFKDYTSKAQALIKIIESKLKDIKLEEQTINKQAETLLSRLAAQVGPQQPDAADVEPATVNKKVVKKQTSKKTKKDGI